jgi:hypothetical protein
VYVNHSLRHYYDGKPFLFGHLIASNTDASLATEGNDVAINIT